MLTTLPLPCQKCYKQVKKGGGDCVDCNKFFCENDSIKVEVGKTEGKTLYGVRCYECQKNNIGYECGTSKLWESCENQKKPLARCAKCKKFIYKKEEAKEVNPVMSCGMLGFDIWCLKCCDKYKYWTTLKRVKTPMEYELEKRCWYCKKALDQEAFKKYKEIKFLLCKECREKELK